MFIRFGLQVGKAFCVPTLGPMGCARLPSCRPSRRAEESNPDADETPHGFRNRLPTTRRRPPRDDGHGGIRTHDALAFNQALYRTELRDPRSGAQRTRTSPHVAAHRLANGRGHLHRIALQEVAGLSGSRTHIFPIWNRALFQLSYVPKKVGRGGGEPPTSRVLGLAACSRRLTSLVELPAHNDALGGTRTRTPKDRPLRPARLPVPPRARRRVPREGVEPSPRRTGS